MESALEEIRFLANSPNRVRVLEALTDGPASRRELQEETGVARSTAARILAEAEDRGWVDSEGSEYRITPVGAVTVSTFGTFVETVQGIEHLGSAVEWLPEPVLALDFRHLRGADVTTPTERRPTAPIERGLERIRSAERCRGLVENPLPRYTAVIRDRVVQGDLEFESVVDAGFVDALRDDPVRAAPWRDLGHRIWVYDGSIPIDVYVVDEVTLLWLRSENRDGDDVVLRGLLESDHPAVASWAESLYEDYRSEAERFDPTALPAD